MRTLLLAAATGMELEAALAPSLDSGTARRGGDAVLAGPVRLTPVVTGVGLVNASRIAGAALARGGVDGVLLAGIAGSHDPLRLPVGTAVAVSEEIWPEYGVEAPPGADARALGFPLLDTPKCQIWDRVPLNPRDAAEFMGLALPAGVAEAPSLSVSTVSGSPERAAALGGRYGASLENMEGFAWALACLEAGAPFVELRGVSNPAGSRRAKDWDAAAGRRAVGRLLEKVLRSTGKDGYDHNHMKRKAGLDIS
jgi:futalosine hydrolase